MVSLDDKYAAHAGTIYLNGLQAIVRIGLVQARMDREAGLNTAGFVSGYRGSPLSSLDTEFKRAGGHLAAADIRVQPGVNEDLAATAVWGTQQIGFRPGATKDGVFAIWYGKGPGVDRCGDVFKHGNLAGSAAGGGVLLVFGDDHANKSSSFPHQSDYAFVSAGIPILSPASLDEYVRYGLLGIALSRFSGCWVAFKAVGEAVESSATVPADQETAPIAIASDFEFSKGGLNIRHPDNPFAQEERLATAKKQAVHAFARANDINRIVVDPPNARMGIVTTGKAHLDTLDALARLGLTEAEMIRRGIRLFKVGMPWPLEPTVARTFAAGLDEVLVIEEKRPLVEDQLAKLFVNWDQRPGLLAGKANDNGTPLLPEFGELDAAIVATAIGKRLAARGLISQQELVVAKAAAADTALPPVHELARSPYFCAGCPHNSSTVVPEGSTALAGIGCHAISMWMPQARAETVTQMGGEGANWIGLAPFTGDDHIFQNLGDGTYFHSGLLAIRAAVSAKVNITYKILFNDAVAMTGGQTHDGPLDPARISRQVHAEGVAAIAVVTDAPEKYPRNPDWAPGVSVHHRRELMTVQKRLRQIKGVTTIIYDQACAAEKRRKRKRGTLDTPDRRLFINEAVCEGCGDCGIKSNCVALQPVETELGRKRQIDQAACNMDYSCAEGFCPSFVSVRLDGTGKPAERRFDPVPDNLPEPPLRDHKETTSVLLAGMGGTGIVTVAAILGMATHIDGKHATVLDQTGLSQKNGAVASHVRIAASHDALNVVRIAAGQADVLLGCDLVVAAAPDILQRCATSRTFAIVNTHLTATPRLIFEPTMEMSAHGLTNRIRDRVRDNDNHFSDFTELATGRVGDPVGANIALLGAAFQSGLIPLSAKSLRKAIVLNGATVNENLAAFEWGRAAVALPAAPTDQRRVVTGKVEPIEALVERHMARLSAYQDVRYARRYRELVHQVRDAESIVCPTSSALAEAVATNYAKLLAYKDEYEVARLYSTPEFRKAIATQFPHARSLSVLMAPPLISKKDPESGVPIKRSFGPWIFPFFRLLARLKFLRGTTFDPFGRTEERMAERSLIAEYESDIRSLLERLDGATIDTAVSIASAPEAVRGYGHVKAKSIAEYHKRIRELKAQLASATNKSYAAAGE